MSNIIFDTLDRVNQMPDEFCPLFAGPPGTGKTQMAKQWMKKNRPEGKVYTFLTSTMPPDEAVGYVVPDKENKILVHHDPEHLAQLTSQDMLFFDELLEGSQETLSACLTLIQERELASGRKLPSGLIICAATNLTLSANALKFNIRQRFDLVHVQFNIQQWVDYVKETLDIDLDGCASDLLALIYISEKSSRWNELTPRKLYKLLMLSKHCSCKELEKMISSLDMLDEKEEILIDIFRTQVYSYKRNLSQLIQETMRHQGIYMTPEVCDKLDSFESDDAVSIIEYLESLPDYDVYKRALNRVNLFGEQLERS